MPTRQQIVNTARTYLGTPFEHCGRAKGHGVDCIGLLVGVCREVGLPCEDLPGYSRFPDGQTLDRELSKNLLRIDPAQAGPGDVLTFWTTRPGLPRHAAIITEIEPEPRLIHTWFTAGRVVEHALDEDWRSRVSGAYRYPGVE